MKWTLTCAAGGAIAGFALWFFKLRIWETGLGGDHLLQLVLTSVACAAVLGCLGYMQGRNRP